MSDLVGKAKNFVAEKIAEIPKPDANLEDVKIKGIARNGITYHAMVGVKNPYPHSISICELVYSLKCGGRLVLSGNMPDPGSMPGNNTTTTLEMPMLVPHDFLVTLAKDVLKGWDIDYELDVGLVMDLSVVGNFTIPLHSKGDIRLPKLSDLFTSHNEHFRNRTRG